MKTLFLFVLLSFFTTVVFSQTITWSPDLVKPAETETNSRLIFPGTDANNYYAVEYELGTRTVKKKWKSFIKTVDKASLKLVKQSEVVGEIIDDGKEYLNTGSFLYQNKQYYFFIDKKDEDIINVTNKVDCVVEAFRNLIS